MRLRYRVAIEHGICLAVLSAVPFLLLLPGALRGSIPVDTRTVLSMPPWEEMRPAGMPPVEHPEANIVAQRYYPWYRFLSRTTSPRDLLWNPMELGGQPFFAAWRTRCLSPFSLPFYIGDANTALLASIYAKLWIAGVFAFFAARRIGLRPALAMIPAAAFQLCGPLLLWPVLPLSDVLPWFPLLFLFAERLALGHYRAWPGGAVVLALMLLGGEPEACAVLFVFAALYFLLRVAGERPGLGHVILSSIAMIAAVLLASGLLAIQILPNTEFDHFAAEGGAPPVQHTPSLDDLSAWFIPYAGNEPEGTVASSAVVNHSGITLILLVAAWIALRAFAEPHPRRRTESLLLLLLLFNTLSFFWLRIRGAIPNAAHVNPEHFLLANGFALGIAGAIAADEWLRLNADEIQSTLKRLMFSAPLVGACCAAALVWSGVHRGLVPGPWWAATLLVIISLATFVILGITVLRPSVRVAGYALAAVVALDLLVTFMPFIPATPASLVFPETPFIALLKKTGGRVTGSAAIGQWPLAGNDVQQLYGCAGIVMRHQADYRAQVEKDPLLLRRSGSPLLLLKQEDIQGAFAPLRELLRIEQVFPTGAVLFYDTEAKGRAWMAYEARNVEKYTPAELSSTQPVLLEQGVPPPPLPPDKQPGVVSVVPSESNGQVTIHLEGVSKGILVLSDAFFPGWKARVDGQTTRVFPVDVLFRGVEVPEGAKEVIFEYDPPLLKVGLLVSGSSLLILIVGMLVLLPSTIRLAKEQRKWSF